MQAGRQAVLAGDPPIVRTQGPAILPMLELGDASGSAEPAEFDRQIEADVAAWIAAPNLPTILPLPAQSPARPDPRAFVCLCEDVRVGDCEQAIADGFADIELLKRRTGAGTGPCQGKLCHAELMACLARAGCPLALPTVRPLLRPVRLMLSPEPMMAVDRADAVIVGGGIAGLALAWELQKRGRRRIVVLERRFTGYGSSMRNMGVCAPCN